MSVTIMNNASRVFDALEEGAVQGVIGCLEHQNVEPSYENVKAVLTSMKWSTESIDYWCEWYGIEKKEHRPHE